MDLVGKTLGNYRIDRLLGEGGMGAVYHAFDLSLQRDVAIKLIHPHLARQHDFYERFIQEARIMAHLDHPGIVKVYMLGKEGDLVYLPMEFIKGDNLRQLLDKLIKEQKWPPLNESLRLMQQLCQILEYAHQHGVLHRDIKPANLMLKPEPSEDLPFRIVLTDLGLAKLMAGLRITQEGTSLGTPAYMSPEQALGQEADPRSDVYSLGILLYELAVGRLPFEIRSITEAIHYHTQVPPPAPRSINPALPETLERIILKALEKDRSNRYSSAAGLGTVLTGIMSVSTEIIDQASRAGVSLITKYQDSIISPPQPASASRMTVLDSTLTGPHGTAVFRDLDIPPSTQTRIQVIEKEKTARVIDLPSGIVTIGRDKDNHIVLDDHKASRKHAQITSDGVSYQVMDLNSSNGTYLGHAKLLPGIPQIWKPNQDLRIGDTWLHLIHPTAGAQSIASSGQRSRTISPYTSAGPVSVTVSPQQLRVETGGSLTSTIFLLNQSPNIEYFSLSLTGIPETWVTSLPSTVKLMPGEQKEIYLSLQVPHAPQSRAGRHKVILRVIGQREPDQSVEVEMTLTVAAFSQFKAELQPQRLRSGQTGRLTISNQGNTTETFTVEFIDPANELAFQPPQIQLSVPEGHFATTEFRAKPRQSRWLGGEKVHVFNALVTLHQGELRSLRAEMVSSGLAPTWIPPIVLVFCFLLIISSLKFFSILGSQTPTLASVETLPFTPPVTTELGAPIVEEWCVYPSDKPPSSFTNCPFQVTASPGQTLIIQWHVNNAQRVIIDPLGDQEPSGNIEYVVTENMPTFILKAENAKKTIEKPIQVIVIPPAPTTLVPITPIPTTAVPTTAVPTTAVPTTQVPTIPPPSGWIAFSSARDGDREVYVMNINGSAPTRLTFRTGDDNRPNWSPNGTRIAFDTVRDGNWEVYVMNADGSGQVNLTQNPSNDFRPTWSPDGAKIVFDSNQDGDFEIFVMKADGSELTQITSNVDSDVCPVWSPDGARIAFVSIRDGKRGLYLMNADGSGQLILTNNLSNDDGCPTWSPDGTRIAFGSNRDGNDEIYTIRTDGSDLTRLTFNSAQDWTPASWSPDGQWLVFLSNRDGNWEVYLMTVDGMVQLNLSQNPSYDAYPSWLP